MYTSYQCSIPSYDKCLVATEMTRYRLQTTCKYIWTHTYIFFISHRYAYYFDIPFNRCNRRDPTWWCQ